MDDITSTWKVRIGTAELPFDPTHISVYTKHFNRELIGLRGSHDSIPTGKSMTFIDIRFMLTNREATITAPGRISKDGNTSTDIKEFARMVAQFRSSFFLPLRTSINNEGINLFSLLIDDTGPKLKSDIEQKLGFITKAIEGYTNLSSQIAELFDAMLASVPGSERLAQFRRQVSKIPVSPIPFKNSATKEALQCLIDSFPPSANIEDILKEFISQHATSPYVWAYVYNDKVKQAIANLHAARLSLSKLVSERNECTQILEKFKSNPQEFYKPTQVALQSIEWASHDTIKPGVVAKVSFVLFNYEPYLNSIAYYKTNKNTLDRTDDIAESDVFDKYYKHWTTSEVDSITDVDSFNKLRSNKCVIPSDNTITYTGGSKPGQKCAIKHGFFEYKVIPLDDSLVQVADQMSAPGEVSKVARSNQIDMNTATDDSLRRELVFRGAQIGYTLKRTLREPEDLKVDLDSHLVSIKCRLQQDFAMMPIQGAHHSTLQFYSKPKGAVTLSFIFDTNSSDDMLQLQSLRSLMKLSRNIFNDVNYSRELRIYPIWIQNYLCNLAGMHFFIFEDISVQNIEGSVGLVTATVTLTEQIVPELDYKSGLEQMTTIVNKTSSGMLGSIIDFIRNKDISPTVRSTIAMRLTDALTPTSWLRWYINSVMPITTKKEDSRAYIGNNIYYYSLYTPNTDNDVRRFSAAHESLGKEVIGASYANDLYDSDLLEVQRALLYVALTIDIMGYYKFIFHNSNRFEKEVPSYSELLNTLRKSVSAEGSGSALSTMANGNYPFDLYDVSGLEYASDFAGKAFDGITFNLRQRDFILTEGKDTNYVEQAVGKGVIWSTNFLNMATPIPNELVLANIGPAYNVLCQQRLLYATRVAIDQVVNAGLLSTSRANELKRAAPSFIKQFDTSFTEDNQMLTYVFSTAFACMDLDMIRDSWSTAGKLISDAPGSASASMRATMDAIEALKGMPLTRALGINSPDTFVNACKAFKASFSSFKGIGSPVTSFGGAKAVVKAGTGTTLKGISIITSTLLTVVTDLASKGFSSIPAAARILFRSPATNLSLAVANMAAKIRALSIVDGKKSVSRAIQAEAKIVTKGGRVAGTAVGRKIPIIGAVAELGFTAYTMSELPDLAHETELQCAMFLADYYGLPFATNVLDPKVDFSPELLSSLEMAMQQDGLAYQSLLTLMSDVVALGGRGLMSGARIASAYPDLDLPTYKDLYDVAESDIEPIRKELEEIVVDLSSVGLLEVSGELASIIVNLSTRTYNDLVPDIQQNMIKANSQITEKSTKSAIGQSTLLMAITASNRYKDAVDRLLSLKSAYVEALLPTYRECGIEPPFMPSAANPYQIKCRTQDHYVDPCCYIVRATMPISDVSPVDEEGAQQVSTIMDSDVKVQLSSKTKSIDKSWYSTPVTTGPVSGPGIDAKYSGASVDVSLADAMILASTPLTHVDNPTVKPIDMALKKAEDELSNRVVAMAAQDRFRGVTTNIINRAFPTFVVYFIREYANKYGATLMSDVFSYIHVMDFVVHKDKLRGATATLTLSNPYGVLDNDRFTSLKSAAERKSTVLTDSKGVPTNLSVEDVESRFNMSEIMLASGTIVNVRQGYRSNPEELENVFSGKIAEISKEGELLILTLQGHEAELMNTADINLDVGFFTGRNYYDWCAQLMSYTSHFGRPFLPWEHAELRKQQMLKRKELYTSGIVEPVVAQFLTSRFNASRATENIWTGNDKTSVIDWLFTDDFDLRDKTLLEGLHEVSRYIPSAVASPLPYDYRSTMFLGPSSHFYKYTDAYDKDAQRAFVENNAVHLAVQALANNSNPSELIKGVLPKIDDWFNIPTKDQYNTASETTPDLKYLYYLSPSHPNNSGPFTLNLGPEILISPARAKKLYINNYGTETEPQSDVVNMVLDLDFTEYIKNLSVEDLQLIVTDHLFQTFTDNINDNDVPGKSSIWFSKIPQLVRQRSIFPQGTTQTFPNAERDTAIAITKVITTPPRNAKFVDTDGTIQRFVSALHTRNPYTTLETYIEPFINQENYDMKYWIALLKAKAVMCGIKAKFEATNEDKAKAEQQNKSIKKKTAPVLYPGYKPFRQYHTITDAEIIRNEIECTVAEMANEIKLFYPSGLNNEGGVVDEVAKYLGILGPYAEEYWTSRTFQFDFFQHGSQKLVRHIREPNAYYASDAINIGFRDLAETMKPMYRGQIVVFGKRDIKPYDVIYLDDKYNKLHGTFEVAEVVHTHSLHNGWTTTIIPHLVTQSYYIEDAKWLTAMDVTFGLIRVLADVWMISGAIAAAKPVWSAVSNLALKPAGSLVTSMISSESALAAKVASAEVTKSYVDHAGAVIGALAEPVGRYVTYRLFTDVVMSNIHKGLYSDIMLSKILEPRMCIAPRTCLMQGDKIKEAAKAAVAPTATFMNPVVIFPMVKNGHPFIAGLDGIDMHNVYTINGVLSEQWHRYWDDVQRGYVAIDEDIGVTIKKLGVAMQKSAKALTLQNNQ